MKGTRSGVRGFTFLVVPVFPRVGGIPFLLPTFPEGGPLWSHEPFHTPYKPIVIPCRTTASVKYATTMPTPGKTVGI